MIEATKKEEEKNKTKQDWSNWNSVYVGFVRFYVMRTMFACCLPSHALS